MRLPPLQLSARSWMPEEDQTERACHTVIDIANDFEHAIADAHSSARCMQLFERIKACVALLEDARAHAIDKADRL